MIARRTAAPRNNADTGADATIATYPVRRGDRHRSNGLPAGLAAAHYLGLLDHALDRHDDADEWFRQALTIHERLGSKLLVAHTDAAWAALLAERHRGDNRDRARSMAEEALGAATVGGYGSVERDAHAILERLH